MHYLLLALIILGVFLLCVIGMAVGVMTGRKPIKHCGSTVNAKGETVECALCGNKSACARNKTADPSGSEA